MEKVLKHSPPLCWWLTDLTTPRYHSLQVLKALMYNMHDFHTSSPDDWSYPMQCKCSVISCYNTLLRESWQEEEDTFSTEATFSSNSFNLLLVASMRWRSHMYEGLATSCSELHPWRRSYAWRGSGGFIICGLNLEMIMKHVGRTKCFHRFHLLPGPEMSASSFHL